MSEEHNWKFAQCFGDKGDSDDITDGKMSLPLFLPFYTLPRDYYLLLLYKVHQSILSECSTSLLLNMYFICLWRLKLFYFPCKILADIISTVEFDQTGDYLATGDKGGRVVLFERNESVK